MKGPARFIKIGSFSGTNDRVLEYLCRQFPDLDADVIDVQDFKAVNRSDAVRLLYSVASNYGAFTHGLPIVTTNIGAIPDFVEQGRSGYMVDCNDPVQLANRLNELLGDPARCATFGARGRAMVDDRYTWQVTAERLAAHIKRSVRLNARVGQYATCGATTNESLAARFAV
jgi:glycosyltransferase involved in cell wall biosynthesis